VQEKASFCYFFKATYEALEKTCKNSLKQTSYNGQPARTPKTIFILLLQNNKTPKQSNVLGFWILYRR
jgi:hypothetical protein